MSLYVVKLKSMTCFQFIPKRTQESCIFNGREASSQMFMSTSQALNTINI